MSHRPLQKIKGQKAQVSGNKSGKELLLSHDRDDFPENTRHAWSPSDPYMILAALIRWILPTVGWVIMNIQSTVRQPTYWMMSLRDLSGLFFLSLMVAFCLAAIRDRKNSPVVSVIPGAYCGNCNLRVTSFPLCLD